MNRFWEWLLKGKEHIGRILWVPLLLNVAMWTVNTFSIFFDSALEDTDFHKLIHSMTSLEIVILVVVIALLRVGKR